MENLTIKKVMEFAVATEEMGAEYYRGLANRFSEDTELAGIFNRLADDETSHAAQFRALAREAAGEQTVSKDPPGLQLRAAVASQFFDRRELEDAGDKPTKQDALVKALAFERSTLFYYQSLKEVLGKNPTIEELVQAEKAHMSALMKVVLADAKFRGLSDSW